jgi:hypothetical protein
VYVRKRILFHLILLSIQSSISVGRLVNYTDWDQTKTHSFKNILQKYAHINLSQLGLYMENGDLEGKN